MAELNLGQYDPELLKLAVKHAVNPAEAASHLREVQVCSHASPHLSKGMMCMYPQSPYSVCGISAEPCNNNLPG